MHFGGAAVSSFSFRGGPVLLLDQKSRLTVPAKYREVLMTSVNGQMVVSKNPDGCLSLFPLPVWERFEAELKDLPSVGAVTTPVVLTVRVATARATLLPLLVCSAPAGSELV